MGKTLAELAEQTGAELVGDPLVVVDGVAPLGRERPGSISFLGNTRLRKVLGTTRASAVILKPELLAECPVAALISANPYLTYAQVAALLHPPRLQPLRIDATARISEQAKIAAGVGVGAYSVVEAGVEIETGVSIGPFCLIGEGACIGAETRLLARVTIGEGTQIGKRCLIHPGAVLGGDGFGFANDHGVWVRIPQLGRLIIGDDVDIGSNSTIDRGALEDTVIEDGTKIDNLVQLGHNVRIGAHAAIAACVGIAGSAMIGKHCQIGGGCRIAGHLALADGVILTGGTLVYNSIKSAGVYSGGVPAQPNVEWRKNVVRVRQLDEIARRLKALERRTRDGLGEVARNGEGKQYGYDDDQ